MKFQPPFRRSGKRSQRQPGAEVRRTRPGRVELLTESKPLAGIEPLEERLLLSVTAAVSGKTVSFTGDAANDDLLLRVSAGNLQYSVDHGSTFSQNFAKAAGATQTVAVGAGTTIDVALGGGTNSLSLDATVLQALNAAAGATLNNFGSGVSDTLIAPNLDSTFVISGENSGHLDGSVAFSGINNLTGGVTNRDTFDLEPAGSLSGLLDGGPGGYHTLVLQGGSYTHEAFLATGPQSGEVVLDSKTIQYAGLQPIIENTTNSGRTVNITSSGTNDQIHVVDAGNGQTTVEDDEASPQFEQVTFTNAGVASLVINPGSGTANIAVDPLEASFVAPITVNDSDTVTLGNITAPAGLSVTATNKISAGPSLLSQAQQVQSDWTKNKTYSGVAQSATTGSGTGMTVAITVDKYGTPTAAVANFGTGYNPGDLVTFAPPDGMGKSIQVVVTSTPSLSQDSQPSDFNLWTANAVDNNLKATSTSGQGTGMLATVKVDAYGNPSISITNQGTGYQIGDVIAFDPPDAVGSPIRVTVDAVLGKPTLPSQFTAWTANQYYTTIAASSTSGAGTGLTAFITTDANGVPTAYIHDDGTGYKVGDTVTFADPADVGSTVTVPITAIKDTPDYDDDWDINQTYKAVTPSSTTGQGTGLTADITTDAVGSPSLSLDTLPSSYQIGETVTFNAPGSGADPISAVVSGIGTISQLPGPRWTAGQTYQGVASTTNGSGTGLTADITVDANGRPTATILAAGTGYKPGDLVTFLDPNGTGDPLVATVGATVAPVISTRAIAVGSNPATAPSTGDSGAINLTAPTINLGQGTQVLAGATGGHQGGAVSLTASAALTFTYADAILPYKDESVNASILVAMQEAGRLDVGAAKLIDAVADGDHVVVRYRPRHAQAIETLRVRRIVNGTGPQGDLTATREPLLCALRDRGLLRADPLRIGIDVDQDSQDDRRERHRIGPAAGGRPDDARGVLGDRRSARHPQADVVGRAQALECAMGGWRGALEVKLPVPRRKPGPRPHADIRATRPPQNTGLGPGFRRGTAPPIGLSQPPHLLPPRVGQRRGPPLLAADIDMREMPFRRRVRRAVREDAEMVGHARVPQPRQREADLDGLRKRQRCGVAAPRLDDQSDRIAALDVKQPRPHQPRVHRGIEPAIIDGVVDMAVGVVVVPARGDRRPVPVGGARAERRPAQAAASVAASAGAAPNIVRKTFLSILPTLVLAAVRVDRHRIRIDLREATDLGLGCDRGRQSVALTMSSTVGAVPGARRR